MEEQPLFSFGVVADVQYADKENGSYEGRIQYYRQAPGKLSIAVSDFNARQQDLSLVLTLGDIIDGNATLELTTADFDVVLEELRKLQVPAVHVLGNHCLSMPREILMRDLKIPARYYERNLGHNWSLVVLDSMDLSTTWTHETPNYKECEEMLSLFPLGEENPQMSTWNGGIGEEQKKWLENVLVNAERNNVRLIVAQHHPLVKGSAPPTHFLWNHDEISTMLLDSPAVAVFLCGHYHPGGYASVSNKHFVTIEAILEAPPDSYAHGIISVYEDRITISGYGAVTSRELQIPVAK